MDEVSTSATDVDLLRAIGEMAAPAAHEADPDRLASLLERLLDCDAVVLVEGDPTLASSPTPVADTDGRTELVVVGADDGVVRGAVRMRRPPTRPFEEGEVVLCELLRPHLSAWLTRRNDPSARTGPYALTQRQREILALVRCGLSNKEVAHALGLTPATVRKHLENAFLKLGVATRTAAVAKTFGPLTGTEDGHV